MKVTDPQFDTLLKRAIVTADRYEEITGDRFSNRVKTFFKRWPRLYNLLRETLGPTHSPWSRYRLKKRIKELFGDAPRDRVILNLGSGTNRLHPEVINVDLFAFKNVDVVADVSDMPFKDAVADGVILDSVMEHIADTPRALEEIARVIKPGGTFIVTSLFMYPYHSSPNDFFRWTEDGIRYLLNKNNFRVRESGIHGGPLGALQGILMHIFATLFSFGSKTAYFLLVQFFMALFSPLKLVDPFFMLFPFSFDAASDIFIIAEKNKE